LIARRTAHHCASDRASLRVGPRIIARRYIYRIADHGSILAALVCIVELAMFMLCRLRQNPPGSRVVVDITAVLPQAERAAAT
jgi:hypothetical protein